MATEQKVARSFDGKKVFVGIDVHRRTYMVTVVCEGEVVWRGGMPAVAEALIGTLMKRFSGAIVHTVYEAGFSGFVLHRALEKAGFRSIVVNPASIPVEANNRVKTDKRDSKKLALVLSKGDFRGIQVPSVEQELRRVVTRTRDQLVEQRTSIMNQVRMKLHQFGLFPLEYNKELSLKDVRQWLKEGGWPLELCSAIQALVTVWETLDAEVKKCGKELKEQAKTDPNDAAYQTLPGIAGLSSRVLSNELGDLQQFKNERQAFSFCGLTPSEFTTGDNVRKGHITRQGSGRLRRVLIQCAWASLRQDAGLKAVYDRIAARAGGKRAIIAVAKKLIGRARAIFKTGEVYDIETSIKAAAV